jgi:serine/threonine-protein kinase
MAARTMIDDKSLGDESQDSSPGGDTMVRTNPGASPVGAYELLDKLGGGGMGDVFRARDPRLDRIVALKTLSPKLISDAGFVQRFQKEARAAARLNHPNIVQIYELGQVGPNYFIAMEYVDGDSLGKMLEERDCFSEREAVGYIRQACRALALAHAEGIVHRDVKPDNMMLSGRGDLKLVDLGLAKSLDEDHSLTHTGMSMGTPHYISPEQVQGLKEIDGRADIYSLGASLYHMVTGCLPFDGSSGAHIMSRHLYDDLADPRQHKPGLSEGVCRVIRKMMAKAPGERYQDIEALDHDLVILEAGGDPEVEEPSATAVRRAIAPPAQEADPGNSALDPQELARIEQELAGAIGPLASVLVKREGRNSIGPDDLRRRLAEHIPSEEARRSFIGGGRASGVDSGARPAVASDTVPPGDGASWDEEVLAAVAGELARHVGPVARVLVKRAARQAADPEALSAALAENVPDATARKAFQEAAGRILS